jgi:transposase
MAWFRVNLTEEEQRVVNEERESHPNLTVRRRMLSLWLLHCGLTRVRAAKVAGVGRVTVERIVEAFRKAGLDGLRHWNRKGPTSELAAYRELIRESFEKEPVPTVAEAAARIEKLTGLRRGPTQVRKFMRGLGMKWQRMRAVPLPPKKVSRSMSPSSRSFCKTSCGHGWRRPKREQDTYSSSMRLISCLEHSCVASGRS